MGPTCHVMHATLLVKTCVRQEEQGKQDCERVLQAGTTRHYSTTISNVSNFRSHFLTCWSLAWIYLGVWSVDRGTFAETSGKRAKATDYIRTTAVLFGASTFIMRGTNNLLNKVSVD